MSPLKRTALNTISGVGVPLWAALTRSDRRRHGLAPPTTRQRFVQRIPGEALEIGPFDKPVIAGPDVAYFDVLDTDALRSRAAEIGFGAGRVPRIDYVSPVGDLAVVDRQFSAVLSSHAVEHQPDLIAHLRGVARILSPGGRYFLIIPDRRYSFDHYLPETDLADVERAHGEKRRVHTRAAVLAHRLGTTHNNALRHWIGIHGRPAPTDKVREDAEAEAVQADRGEYVDVHAWTFSPASFRRIVSAPAVREIAGLEPEVVHDTAFADLEFFAVLRKPA